MRPTIQQLSQEIREGSISPVEVTSDCLTRIEKLNPALNAFITVLADSALDQARRAEQEIRSGHYRGPLHGIPIGLKDILDTAGVRTTAASAQYKDRIPSEDAEVVRRVRAAGAVVLGKQNLHEFAYGGSSMLSFFGEVHNAWDTARIAEAPPAAQPAASPLASASRPSAPTPPAPLRLPAAYCGVVGLKPTYGRVSARGVVPLAWSFDHVGPLTNSVRDAALMLQVLAGYDAGDPASIDAPVPDYSAALEKLPPRLRIGVPRSFFFDDLHPEVAAAIEQAIRVFLGLHAEIRDIKLEVSTDRTLSSAESWAFHEAMLARSPELYQPATLGRIQSGANISRCRRLAGPPRVGSQPSRDPRSLRQRGHFAHAYRPDSAAADYRTPPAPRRPAPPRATHAAQYAAIQCLGNSHDFGAVRTHVRWPADRPPARGPCLAGRLAPAGGAGLRTSH